MPCASYLRFSDPDFDPTCNLCDNRQFIYGDGETGDEFHYLFHCTHFRRSRDKYLSIVNEIQSDEDKFIALFNSNDPIVLKKLSSFVRIILESCDYEANFDHILALATF